MIFVYVSRGLEGGGRLRSGGARGLCGEGCIGIYVAVLKVEEMETRV